MLCSQDRGSDCSDDGNPVLESCLGADCSTRQDWVDQPVPICIPDVITRTRRSASLRTTLIILTIPQSVRKRKRKISHIACPSTCILLFTGKLDTSLTAVRGDLRGDRRSRPPARCELWDTFPWSLSLRDVGAMLCSQDRGSDCSDDGNPVLESCLGADCSTRQDWVDQL